MDLGFDRRFSRRQGGAQPALDYVRLVSSVAATQAGSRTAATEARLASSPAEPEDPVDALVRLFDPSFGWAAGVAALGGSFHPGLAGSAAIRVRSTT